jgi:hypothetical protein
MFSASPDQEFDRCARLLERDRAGAGLRRQREIRAHAPTTTSVLK